MIYGMVGILMSLAIALVVMFAYARSANKLIKAHEKYEQALLEKIKALEDLVSALEDDDGN